ncbi:unnamed protein product [Ilex paraguariensis]|uniref:WIYLD domain-containing protein n=1 Tax=Ilex paraguariensis TaxID=185542 RepID=A0ABC8QSQ0_9AQUA
MAPRRRHRKPRLSRMDAAIDAMAPLGFPQELVIKRVKDLLKVYGGDEGWPFIEADAYKVLLDAIFEEEEGNDEDKCREDGSLFKDDSLHDERTGDQATSVTAGPSGAVVEPIFSEVVNTASQSNNTESGDYIPLAEEHGKVWKEIGCTDPSCSLKKTVDSVGNTNGNTGGGIHLVNAPDISCLDRSCSQKETVDLVGSTNENSRVGKHLENAPVYSPPPLIPSLPSKSLPNRRHRPCYGWIEDDDNDDDFIELTPAPRLAPATLLGIVGNSNRGTEQQVKRKTRWDQRPEDL